MLLRAPYEGTFPTAAAAPLSPQSREEVFSLFPPFYLLLYSPMTCMEENSELQGGIHSSQIIFIFFKNKTNKQKTIKREYNYGTCLTPLRENLTADATA